MKVSESFIRDYYIRFLDSSLPTLSAIDYGQLVYKFESSGANVFERILSSVEHLGKITAAIDPNYTRDESVGILIYIATESEPSFLKLAIRFDCDKQLKWSLDAIKSKGIMITSELNDALSYLEFLDDRDAMISGLLHEPYFLKGPVGVSEASVKLFLAECEKNHIKFEKEISYIYRGIISRGENLINFDTFRRVHEDLERIRSTLQKEKPSYLGLLLTYAILPWELDTYVPPKKVEKGDLVKPARKKSITIPKYSRHSVCLPDGVQSEGWEVGVATWKGEKFVFFEHKHENSRHGFPHEIEKCLDMWTYAEDLDQFFASLEN